MTRRPGGRSRLARPALGLRAMDSATTPAKALLTRSQGRVRMSKIQIGIVSKIERFRSGRCPLRTPDRPTIADVAAVAGVGVGTVSRVLNGGVNGRESTRQNVLEVIERLGYRPSHLAGAPAPRTQRTVALLGPHPATPTALAR